MKNKIIAGEFVRAINGQIFRVERIDDGYAIAQELNEAYGFSYVLAKEDIVKHGSNILKVLANGDLVNGRYVVADIHSYGFYFFEDGGVSQNQFDAGDIETVVTREQLESISYPVNRRELWKTN